MPVTPLFMSSVDTVKASLRLTGATQSDTNAAIAESIQNVRTKIYSRLGATRVGQILGYASVENPATEEQLIRTNANLLEAAWVRLLLIRRLPMLFQDASGQSQMVWNEEGSMRRAGASDLEREIARLEAEIEQFISLLDTEDGNEGGVQGGAIGPTTTPPLIGRSIFSTGI